MDSDYGNVVYGQQIHSNLPPEGMLLENSGDNVKDIQYASRDSIITSSMHPGHMVYQQEEQTHHHHLQQDQMAPHPDGSPTDMGNQQEQSLISSAKLDNENESVVSGPAQQEVEPIENPNENRLVELTEESQATSVAAAELPQPDEAAADEEMLAEATEPIKTAALEIEPLAEENAPSSPAVTISMTKNDDQDVDQNQCRVCLSKVNLVNIFAYENNMRISDIIMSICTTIKITERDYLPHYVCTSCVDKVKIAVEFKTTCESTDKHLRSKLKRGKNKGRRGRDFILVDCEMSSGNSDIDNAKDDDEFQISDANSESDASFTLGKKKKGTRSKKKSPKKKVADAKGKAKKYKKSNKVTSSMKKEPQSQRSTRYSNRTAETASYSAKRFRPHDVVFVEAPSHISDEEESEGDETPRTSRRGRYANASKTLSAKSTPPAPASRKSTPKSATPVAKSTSSSKIPHKKRAIKPETDEDDDEVTIVKTELAPPPPKDYSCQYCDQIFPSRAALKEHKKCHVGEKPLACQICNKPFKQKVSLDAHVQKHKDDDSRMCKSCDKQFASRLELRKHQQTAHESEYTFECEKCKRSFTTKSRLEKHKESKCPGFDTTQKKKPEAEITSNLGRDLFKCVAPLTTTYWSDSFSE